MYHFDAYRLSTELEFFDLGIQEYFTGDGVCLVEWADRVPGCLPDELLWIRIEVTGERSRRVTVEGCGTRYVELLSQLRPLVRA